MSYNEQTPKPHEIRDAEQLRIPEITLLARTAIDASLASARVVQTAFGRTAEELHTEYKRDGTPKTIADEEGDAAIVRVIRGSRPQDDIRIEESGFHSGLQLQGAAAEDKLTWYADSLDGTRPFTEGKPESTVGVGVFDKDGQYLAAAVVHPFRKQIAVAVRGQGAMLYRLTDDLEIKAEEGKRLEVSMQETLKGATVSVDSLFNGKTRGPKRALMSEIEDAAGGLTSYDMIGSNIASQLDVARGGSQLGITDAKGGDWDWKIGEAIISEAGGVMIDPTTGEKPTEASEVMIYGSHALVDIVLPMAKRAYEGYQGFK